jgi:hypothetical protein
MKCWGCNGFGSAETMQPAFEVGIQLDVRALATRHRLHARHQENKNAMCRSQPYSSLEQQKQKTT